MKLFSFIALPFLSLILLTGCVTTSGDGGTTSSSAPLNLQKTSFSALSGWLQDDLKDVASAYKKSCARILKKKAGSKFGTDPRFGLAQDWQPLCRRLNKISNTDTASLRQFFETYFVPYQVSAGRKTTGLFTGYYEAALNGSKTKTARFKYPLRKRPRDLVMVNLGEFRDDLKGRRIAGRVKGGQLKPYEDHAQIIAGKLPAKQDQALVWVDNPVDAFLVQIQGSGVVALPNGKRMRIGYAGQNGHPYYAIGKELIARGAIAKRDMSMPAIRRWLKTHPKQAYDVMTKNPSYVFFRELTGTDYDGPQGGEGVSLTPRRSLAIDHSIIPYGIPVWLDVAHPDKAQGHLRRLIITQDTGGAIRGPVRGDFFWGYGAEAENLAGHMKSEGRYWFLLPKSL